MFAVDVNVLHCATFKTHYSRIRGCPPSFSRERISFLVNSVYSVKCMSMCESVTQICSLVFRCSSPTTSLQKSYKKTRVDIFLCKCDYIAITLPHIEIQPRQTTLESDLKIEWLRWCWLATLGWTQSSLEVIWPFKVHWLVYVTQKIPDFVHRLCCIICMDLRENSGYFPVECTLHGSWKRERVFIALFEMNIWI